MRKLLLHTDSRKVRRIDRFRSYLVTTGAFDRKNLDELNNNAFGTREDTVFDLWDRERLTKKLNKAGFSVLVDIIERYY
jgi:hypothetical protein